MSEKVKYTRRRASKKAVEEETLEQNNKKDGENVKTAVEEKTLEQDNKKDGENVKKEEESKVETKPEIEENTTEESVKDENKDEIIVDEEKQLSDAKDIVKKHILISAGFGAVPVPMVDLIGLTGTQLNMLKELSAVYNQKFTHEIAKKSIISLAGGSLTIPISVGLYSLIKFVPVIGQTAGVISVATVGASATYAVGEVFIKHFQSGGTWLTFDVNNFKEYFKEKFSKGKDVVEEIKEEESIKTTDKKENEVDNQSKA